MLDSNNCKYLIIGTNTPWELRSPRKDIEHNISVNAYVGINKHT